MRGDGRVFRPEQNRTLTKLHEPPAASFIHAVTASDSHAPFPLAGVASSETSRVLSLSSSKFPEDRRQVRGKIASDSDV